LHYQTILFDLDGTLIDSFDGITRSAQYALKEFGITVENREQLRPFIGPPLLDSFQDLYHFPPEKAALAVKKYRERYETIGWQENTLYDGIPELLRALHGAGKTLCIASSKPTVFVKRILHYFELEAYFAHISAADLVGGLQHKSEIVDAVFTRHGADRQHAVMIGDRKFDAQGALDNQVDFIGACYGYGSREELAAYPHAYLADSAADIGTFLLGESRG
jgi:phosphoglycolate phosphatase